jgi:hypothetical protein
VAAKPDLFARYFLYDFVCDGTNPAEKEHNFGILNHDLSPRPAFVAAAVAARSVEGRPFLRHLRCAREDVQAQLFGPAKSPVLAVWATEVGYQEKIAHPKLGQAGSAMDKAVPVTVAVDGKRVVVTDWQGRSRTVPVVDGKVQLVLGTWPQYVTGVGAGVSLLKE